MEKITLRQVIVFSFNFKRDFIKEVWKGEEMMIEHLENKLELYFSKSKSSVEGVMKFMAELDLQNLEKMETYIKSNYK